MDLPFSHFSLLTSHFSLLTSHFSLLTSHCLQDFIHQSVGQRILRDFAHDLAMTEEKPFAPAAGNAEICLARLTGTVHHAPHDRHGKGGVQILQPPFYLFGNPDEVDLAAAAGGTGDKVYSFLTQAEGFEYLESDPNLIHRVTGQRDPQGIANSVGEKDAEPDSRLD